MAQGTSPTPPREGSRRAALWRALARRSDAGMLAYWPRAFLGDWRDVMEDEGCDLLSRATLLLAQRGDRAPWPLAHEGWAGRSLALTCYGDAGAVLYDFVLRDLTGQTARAGFILCQDELVLLDNTSAPIHDFNLVHPPQLGDESNVLEYLRMFCWVICGDSGPFQIVEDQYGLPFELIGEAAQALPEPLEARRALRLVGEDDVPAAPTEEVVWPPGEEFAQMSEDERQSLFAKLEEQRRRNAPRPEWMVRATVHYEVALFRSEFAVFSSGMVEMVDDERKSEVLRSPVWRVASPLRYHLPPEPLEP